MAELRGSEKRVTLMGVFYSLLGAAAAFLLVWLMVVMPAQAPHTRLSQGSGDPALEQSTPQTADLSDPTEVGRLVATASFNIDMDADRDGNSAVQRNAGFALTRGLIERLQREQRAVLYARDGSWDRWREEGIVRWLPSRAVLLSKDGDSRTYKVFATPVYKDGDSGEAIEHTVRIRLVQTGYSKWQADSIEGVVQ